MILINLSQRRSKQLTLAKAVEVIGRLEHGERERSIAQRFWINQKTVSDIRHGRTWPALQPFQNPGISPHVGQKHSEEAKRTMAEKKRLWWQNASEEKRAETQRRIAENHARPSKGKTGPQSGSWKGGRYTNKRDKYIYVYAPDHPNCVKATNNVGGYVLEHRLVMEKILGRYLHPDEDVNHRNGIKDDNRPDNLRLVSHFAHFEEHGCPSCGFKFLTR